MPPHLLKPLGSRPAAFFVWLPARLQAAIDAGLAAVPCWLSEMGDAEAYMLLVTANTQGEHAGSDKNRLTRPAACATRASAIASRRRT